MRTVLDMISNIFIHFMPWRYNGMNDAITGFNQTGIWGVAYNNDMSYHTVGQGDSTGIYIFAQLMNRIFSINVDQIVFMFHVFFSLLSLTILLMTLFKSTQKLYPRLIGSLAFVLLILTSLIYGDVYILLLFSSSLIFFSICCINRNSISSMRLFAYALIAGIAIGISNWFRYQSGYGLLIFMILFLAVHSRIKIRTKISSGIFLVVGMGVVQTVIYVFNQAKDNYFSLVNPDALNKGFYTIWHTVYIGLGFVNNTHVAKYNDFVAMDKVASIDPTALYGTPEYNQIIRDEFFDLVLNQPHILFINMTAKIAILILFILIFSNYGLVFIRKNFQADPKSARGRLALLLPSLVFNCLFGLAAVPRIHYLLGYISIIVIYTVIEYIVYCEAKQNLRLDELFLDQND